MMYIVAIKPYNNAARNRLEVFNEACVMICCYHSLLFADLVIDESLNYNLGWSVVFITLLNICVNFLPDNELLILKLR